MSILQAFESAKETDYGRLNGEIEQIHDELTWGIPLPQVMAKFSRRMDSSDVIQESISILLQSFKSGGNITKTIESIAEDSTQLKETIQKKRLTDQTTDPDNVYHILPVCWYYHRHLSDAFTAAWSRKP